MTHTSRFFALITIAAGSLLHTGACFAAITNGTTVTVDKTGAVGGIGGGGEFHVSGGGESFLTFCLERNEYISAPGTYIASINQGAIGGGESGSLAGDYYDPLSKATQWFYGQFYNNTLDTATGGLFVEGASATAANWASALQLVFWRLEGEADYVNNKWVDFASHGTVLASSSLNSAVYADANALWNWYNTVSNKAIVDAGDSHVQVLNLWSTSLTQNQKNNLGTLDSSASFRDSLIPEKGAQSQLYYNSSSQEGSLPTPEPATLAIWSSFVACGLALSRVRAA